MARLQFATTSHARRRDPSPGPASTPPIARANASRMTVNATTARRGTEVEGSPPAKCRFEPRGVPRHQRTAGLEPQHLEEAPYIDQQAGEQDDQRCEKDGRDELQRHLQRSRHVYNCRTRAPRQIPCGSQRRAAPIHCAKCTAGSNTRPAVTSMDARLPQRAGRYRCRAPVPSQARCDVRGE